MNIATPFEGWHSLPPEEPRLYGLRCSSCGAYFFPPTEMNFCRNPDCDGEHFQRLALSDNGRLWSFSEQCYEPPPPYKVDGKFRPYMIAVVELERERMLVTGRMPEGVRVDKLKIGMQMRLTFAPLVGEAGEELQVWAWEPAT